MTELFRVVILLVRLTKDIQHSRLLVTIILVAGIISGLSNTALIATINSTLNRTGTPASAQVLAFAGLCLVLASMRFVSGAVLFLLMKKVMVSLRLQLCRKILTAPLRALEQLGSARLYATLTGDVPGVANAFVFLPLLCMNLAILLGCLIYLCWLSPLLLLGALVFMAIGIISHQLPVKQALKYFERARETTDVLFKHLRSLVEGTKELKLHRRRRNAFYSELLEPTARSSQQDLATGDIIWTAAGSWGQILFFIFIGLVLFVVPTLRPRNSLVLTGYTLTVMYMMGPLEFVLNFVPNLTQANVAMKKIDAITESIDEQFVIEAAPDTEVKPSWNSLEVVGIQHSYRHENEEAEFSLGPLDLSLRPPFSVAVGVGRSAMGARPCLVDGLVSQRLASRSQLAITFAISD